MLAQRCTNNQRFYHDDYVSLLLVAILLSIAQAHKAIKTMQLLHTQVLCTACDLHGFHPGEMNAREMGCENIDGEREDDGSSKEEVGRSM